MHLHSGSSFFVRDATVSELGLAEGMSLSDELIATIETSSHVLDAEAKAVGFLAVREHSVFQIRQKLAKRKYDSGVIAEVCALLEQKGYVDDRRFAALWVENRLQKRNEGKARLLAGLARTGVSREVAAEAVDGLVSDDDEREAFDQTVAALERTASSSERIARRLARLGFPSEWIRRYLEDRGSRREDV